MPWLSIEVGSRDRTHNSDQCRYYYPDSNRNCEKNEKTFGHRDGTTVTSIAWLLLFHRCQAAFGISDLATDRNKEDRFDGTNSGAAQQCCKIG